MSRIRFAFSLHSAGKISETLDFSNFSDGEFPWSPCWRLGFMG
jgi:hypothetical protein